MFHKNLKLIITALLVGTGIWQIVESYIGNGIMLIVLSFVFVFLYFKNELILLSFLRLRKQDFPGAKKWLDKIKNPEASLVRKQQGYYNYLNGLMLSQTNMNEAEKYFKIRPMLETLCVFPVSIFLPTGQLRTRPAHRTSRIYLRPQGPRRVLSTTSNNNKQSPLNCRVLSGSRPPR